MKRDTLYEWSAYGGTNQGVATVYQKHRSMLTRNRLYMD